MAKKQQESQKNKATRQKKQVEDKTFGLKNKNKSSKVQAYVKQVEGQAPIDKRKEAEAARKAAEKKAAEQAKAEARSLFGAAVTPQKVPFGVDPKSVLCEFFKQGICSKGTKCKFSHDLNVGRKTAKKDLYSDVRSEEKDTMDTWDDEKLASVVLSKHGKPQPTTTIICKHFIEAVENGKYGWFWVCPNGGETCKYRHSLPQGFKLKTKEEQRLERQAAANEHKVTLEEIIDSKRLLLPKQLTPVTPETFAKWKEARREKKLQLAKEAAKQKGPLSGRQLMDSGRFLQDDEEDSGWDLRALRSETERLGERLEGEPETETTQTTQVGAQAIAV